MQSPNPPSPVRLALVTGAGKGIGLAIARRLLAGGFRVIGTYCTDDAAAESARRECPERDNLIMIKVDLSELAGVDIIAQTVAEEGGVLEYLVSNVGITDRSVMAETKPENWERVLRTNLTVPFFLVRHLANALPDQRGRILFIGAVMGMRPHPVSHAYGASKAGLHFLAQCLVKEFSPRGVTVNVVAPGFVDTAMQAGKSPDHRVRVERRIAMGRFALADEVAMAAVSLLEQGYVTGQVLAVDGGYDCA